MKKIILPYSGSAISSLDDGVYKSAKISGQIIDDLDDGIKIKPFAPLKQSTPRFNVKHVLDDLDFDQALTLDRKAFLANKRM